MTAPRRVVKVTSAQVLAAQTVVAREQAAGREVSPAVRKIAEARPAVAPEPVEPTWRNRETLARREWIARALQATPYDGPYGLQLVDIGTETSEPGKLWLRFNDGSTLHVDLDLA